MARAWGEHADGFQGVPDTDERVKSEGESSGGRARGRRELVSVLVKEIESKCVKVKCHRKIVSTRELKEKMLSPAE